MADRAHIFDATRMQIATLVLGLSDEELERSVPATPGWSVRDIVSHLTGDVVCMLAGDFPQEFFAAFGSEQGVISLNAWTDKQVRERRGRPLRNVLDEWEGTMDPLLKMMRGETPWPDGVLPIADHILLTDIATHQQDIYGALGLERDRGSVQIRIGTAAYIGGVRLRLQMQQERAIRFVTEDKEVVVGDGEPQASVRAPRFELFRALSGRRNPDQIKAFEWEGDPEPFIPYFYPYGVRQEALVE